MEKNLTINSVRILVKELMMADIDGNDETEIRMNKVNNNNNMRVRLFENHNFFEDNNESNRLYNR